MVPRRSFLGSTWIYSMLRTRAEIRSPKSCDAAEWLAIQNNSSCQKSDSDQQLLPRHHTNPISPPRERDAWFSKNQTKKNTFSKRVIFSTDCRQSMGLQSVLKIRVKTSKIFALRASPYKGSKPRVNLDQFIFSTTCSMIFTWIFTRIVYRFRTGRTVPYCVQYRYIVVSAVESCCTSRAKKSRVLL
jgi:hypothetical protein